jgi:hypothetical protein
MLSSRGVERGHRQQHRGLNAAGPAAQHAGQNRLDSAFDTIRAEFDGLTQEVISLRKQREELDTTCVCLCTITTSTY